MYPVQWYQQKEIQKGHSLDSYKLDDVSAHFMKGRIVESGLIKTELSSKQNPVKA